MASPLTALTPALCASAPPSPFRLDGRHRARAAVAAAPAHLRAGHASAGERGVVTRSGPAASARRRRGHAGAGAPQRLAAAAAGDGAPASAEGCVVVVDNYDSFTYNLCQYLGDLGCKYVVYKNDQFTVEEIQAMAPAGIMVSPGPGRPEDSGISLEIIEKLGPLGMPVFGVCMGHQCIGQVFGGDIIRAPCGVMHGKSSLVTHTGVGLLEGLPNPFKAARYHSLVIDKDTCPEDIEVTGWTEDGTIMACRHKKYPLVQ
eukprot:jgi/Tetstr1/465513/TSEL_010182.t1